jgi:hypothetical protein
VIKPSDTDIFQRLRLSNDSESLMLMAKRNLLPMLHLHTEWSSGEISETAAEQRPRTTLCGGHALTVLFWCQFFP